MKKRELSHGISALEEDLLTLLKQRKLYGLEILSQVNQVRSRVSLIELTIGALYPTLGKLEQKGLVNSSWGEDQNPGARRKYYTVTDGGLSALAARQQVRLELGATNSALENALKQQKASGYSIE